MRDLYTALIFRVPVGKTRYIQPWWMIFVGLNLVNAVWALSEGHRWLVVIALVGAVGMIWPLTDHRTVRRTGP